MDVPRQPIILALVGPTAVGKTELALRLAERMSADILSVDSMQVYRGMDIGTAKPTAAELARVPHHLVDVADPREFFSVAEYCEQARVVLDFAQHNHRPVIACGGTGLYFKALLEGLAVSPPPDPVFRQQQESLARQMGCHYLHAKLASVDPYAAQRIHPHDLKRVIRALEIYAGSGESKTTHEQQQTVAPYHHRTVWVGLARDREDLVARIDQRVDAMVANGLLREVEALTELGCCAEHTAMQALGYKEVLAHLNGEISLSEAIVQIKKNTRRYARRQMSWFRANQAIVWFHPAEENLEETILRICSQPV